ncbi:hypothetical protein TI39_contig5903g00001 [Zymoseptoria brevis]|uniref:Uncharacterized protein n=1 Tax=Zymoseptoria brevis TaxID=1047168 RepID=A0A0F4G7D8_9PEZI|nr:hypothetical protein TI39_contig5903g00001 [Zymoseptoria brevis]
MSANDRLRILQDAAQNLWSKDFISPARLVQLIVLLDCPFYEGKPVTVICMEETLNTIAGLVTPNVLGEGLRSQISAGGFSFAAHLRSHILSSTTLHQALAVPPPPSTSPNGPPARLRGRSDVPHRSNAALIQASIALVEQQGAFSGRRVRGRRGGGDGERDAGQKEKYRGQLDGEGEKKVRAMIALLRRTRDQRVSATCYAWWSVRETPMRSREHGVCI